MGGKRGLGEGGVAFVPFVQPGGRILPVSTPSRTWVPVCTLPAQASPGRTPVTACDDEEDSMKSRGPSVAQMALVKSKKRNAKKRYR